MDSRGTSFLGLDKFCPKETTSDTDMEAQVVHLQKWQTFVPSNDQKNRARDFNFRNSKITDLLQIVSPKNHKTQWQSWRWVGDQQEIENDRKYPSREKLNYPDHILDDLYPEFPID